MINFSICVSPDNKINNVISLLLMIDEFHDKYTCTISGCQKLKESIELFPYSFKGQIEVVVENVNDKYSIIELLKRKLNIIKYTINKYNNTTHISSDIFFTNTFYLPDNINDIGFIKRKVYCLEDESQRQFSFDILFLADTKYIDFIFSIFNENIPNFMSHCDNSDSEEKEEHEKKCRAIWNKIPLNLIDKFEVTDFLPFYFCITTNDFFALDDSIKLDNINCNGFKYKEINDEECDESQQYSIISIAIKRNVLAPPIKALNKELFNKLLLYTMKYMTFINLKYSNKNIEFIIPKKDGIGIWDRTNDKPGLYELIDLIVESYPSFFSKTEVNIDYFSINNFLISDKPSMKWLNNTIRKYSRFLTCNYDNTLIDYIDELPIGNQFLSYYSDHPKVIENMVASGDYNKKIFDIIKINDDVLEIYEIYNFDTFRSKKLIKKIDVADLDFQSKYEIISKSRYVIYNNYDIHLLSNCLALGVVPLLKDSIILLDLKHETHYIYENELYNIEYQYLDNSNNLCSNCKEYFQNNIKSSSFIRKILNSIFIGGC